MEHTALVVGGVVTFVITIVIAVGFTVVVDAFNSTILETSYLVALLRMFIAV